MNRKVKVAMPVNTILNGVALFKDTSYQLPSPRVRYIKNAFVTNSGLVCNSNGLIKESCHYKWEGQLQDCLSEAVRYYYATEENAENLQMFDDNETYLVIHNRWQVNYFHWLNEAIYRLWLVKDKADGMILLLPSKEQLSNVAIDSLKIFNLKNIVFIPEGKSVQVSTLCLPSQKPVMESYNPKALNELRDMYLKYSDLKGLKSGSYERIYVSRRNARRRKIVNEKEVIATLLRYGFNVVYCENYTFFEQVSLFSKAKYLASNHGAGLTNMLFMPRGSTVLELLKRKTNPVRHHSKLFWYMADALGHKYYQQICEPTDVDELFFEGDIDVDIELLNKNLEILFGY
jgi:capsular polysaccharide biosynthesis protein